jgi:Kip1 ubiquitination-promoting complex protein 1
VIKDTGFGHAAFGVQPPQGSLQRLLLGLLEEGTTTPALETTAAGDAAAAAEAAEAEAAAARVRGFLNKLFNTLNWTLTEFSMSVDDLRNLRGRRSILEAQNQYRRTGLMFELSVNFLRILEFVVVSAGQHAGQGGMNGIKCRLACSLMLTTCMECEQV